MVSEFTWHKVGEKEFKEIKKQAKEIMDKFSEEISEIKLSEKGSEIERGKSDREEGSVEISEMDKEIFFGNAPEKSKDFIFVEKKKW